MRCCVQVLLALFLTLPLAVSAAEDKAAPPQEAAGGQGTAAPQEEDADFGTEENQ